MSIRFATAEDIDAVVELAARMRHHTRFASLPFSPDRLQRSLATLLEDKTGRYVFLLATSADGLLAGGLIGVLERHIFSDQLTASVMHFDVLPEYRMGGHAVRLLHVFERWAKNRGVVEIVFGVNSGGDYERVGRFAKKMGFRVIGENYARAC